MPALSHRPTSTPGRRWSSTPGTSPRRPGAMREARAGRCRHRRSLGLELIGVPDGADARPRPAAGVGVRGRARLRHRHRRRSRASAGAACARSADTLDVRPQELYAYEHSTTDETTDEDEVGRLQGDLIDLEPALRDAVVLALPTNPLCREDCPGLCPECGVPWDDLPADHSHEQVDAALGGADAICRDDRGVENRGRSEAQDVAQQHPVAPGALEGDAPAYRPCACQQAEAAARRLPGLRHLQRPPGPRGLTTPSPGDAIALEPSHWAARIAVDLLGGDDAPAVVVDGALRACDADPDLHLLLVGPRRWPTSHRALAGATRRARRRSCRSSEVGRHGRRPRCAPCAPSATRPVPRSPRARRDGAADALVSAGASGADRDRRGCSRLGRLPGVRRPALRRDPARARPARSSCSTSAPARTPARRCWPSTPSLGAAYAPVAHGSPAPRVGLLSIGSRARQGRPAAPGAPSRCCADCCPAPRYVGLVEGHDVAARRRAPTSSSPTASPATSCSRASRARTRPARPATRWVARLLADRRLASRRRSSARTAAALSPAVSSRPRRDRPWLHGAAPRRTRRRGDDGHSRLTGARRRAGDRHRARDRCAPSARTRLVDDLPPIARAGRSSRS